MALLPPRVASGVFRPFCQTNGRHMRCVPKPQKSSPYGSGFGVSEKAETSPLSLSGKNAVLLGPPSVPRSVFVPMRHRSACWAVLPARVAAPATQPLLLDEYATLDVPPSVPRSMSE